MQLGARGTSVLFSSGDGGVSGQNFTSCPISDPEPEFVPTFPSGCPYITSVGATVGTKTEEALYLSSGGFSNIFTRPSYQATAASAYLDNLGSTYEGRFNTTGRGFPDISAQGYNITFIFNNTLIGRAGTSFASPIFASVFALLNDELIGGGKPPLGFLNPFLYYTGASALNDVTQGKRCSLFSLSKCTTENVFTL